MKRHVTTANALRRLTTQSALVQIDQASQQPIYLDQFWSRIAIGLRLCKCVPTAPSPKTLKRQPHEQAPRYSRSTFLAIRKVHSRKPRTFVLYVTVFGLRRCRYPRSTSLRTPHTGGIASRVTPVSRAACSYPGHLQFHVHVPEGLKPGTQSRFCCSTRTARVGAGNPRRGTSAPRIAVS